MFFEALRELYTTAISATKPVNAKSAKGIKSKSDPSTLGIVFMAFVCAVLPLDISQLSFAILGAVLYALLQKSDQFTAKKPPIPLVVNAAPCAPKPKPSYTPSKAGAHAKPSIPATPIIKQETRTSSIQPIVTPTFQSKCWEGEIQELLLQITPTSEVEQIVNKLAQNMAQAIRKIIPEIEVTGFASGNLTSGKAFGVAVPEVDIIANASPHILFERLHGHSTKGSASQLDAKKLQKCAIRACTDRLVSAAGFKFRRSAFRGQEPKVTLLAPASLGLFSESIPIDFAVNVVTPFYNAALLTECGQIDSRAKELILIVKRWAKDRGICHAAKGHLSPYLWGLLTIYFLQVGVTDEGALLPPLDQFEMSAGLLANDKRQKASADTPKQRKWKPAQTMEPKKSVGQLFKEFVKFFETQFDWRNEAVSVRAGQRGPPSVDLPLNIMVADGAATSQVGPSVEDPFCAAQNLAEGMNSASFARLKEELSRAAALCSRGASLSELLEPWVPPDFESGESHHHDELSNGSGKASPATGTCQPQASTTSIPTTPPWRRTGAPATKAANAVA